jgi:hypothetical protein
MFVTSFTTATAFFTSAMSPIVSIKCFSVYASLAVIVCYSLMITWLPAVVVISHKYIGPRWQGSSERPFAHLTVYTLTDVQSSRPSFDPVYLRRDGNHLHPISPDAFNFSVHLYTIRSCAWVHDILGHLQRTQSDNGYVVVVVGRLSRWTGLSAVLISVPQQCRHFRWPHHPSTWMPFSTLIRQRITIPFHIIQTLFNRETRYLEDF